MVVESKMKALKLLTLVYLLFAFCLAISSFAAAGTCYVTPCYQGIGVETLWKVSNGVGFVVRPHHRGVAWHPLV
jgi:hypothetical protein